MCHDYAFFAFSALLSVCRINNLHVINMDGKIESLQVHHFSPFRITKALRGFFATALGSALGRYIPDVPLADTVKVDLGLGSVDFLGPRDDGFVRIQVARSPNGEGDGYSLAIGEASTQGNYGLYRFEGGLSYLDGPSARHIADLKVCVDESCPCQPVVVEPGECPNIAREWNFVATSTAEWIFDNAFTLPLPARGRLSRSGVST